MLIKVSITDEEQYDFDTSTLDVAEAEAVERVCGCTYTEWWQKLEDGSATALKALVWTLRKAESPDLRFSEVKFPIGELRIEIVPDPTPPPSGDTGN